VNALCRCVRLWISFVFISGVCGVGVVCWWGCAWVVSGVATGAEGRVWRGRGVNQYIPGCAACSSEELCNLSCALH
jgi:hypothetical protein